jgi:hypothetical protein
MRGPKAEVLVAALLCVGAAACGYGDDDGDSETAGSGGEAAAGSGGSAEAGSGGGTDGSSDAGEDAGDSGDGSSEGVSIPGFDFELESGMAWELIWHERSSSNYAGDASGSYREGLLRIRLGEARTIDGIEGYSLELEGEVPENAVSDWSHLAMSDHRILGFRDGTEWTILFDAGEGAWPGVGFFFGGETYLLEAQSLGDGQWKVDVSEGTDNCQTFGSLGTICGGEMDTNYTVYDLYREEQGFDGYYNHYGESDWSSGGNWSYSSTDEGEVVAFINAAGVELGGYTCAGLLWCVSLCAEDDDACIDACWNETSGYGRLVNLDLLDCVETGAECGAQYDACSPPRTCAGFLRCDTGCTASVEACGCLDDTDADGEQKAVALMTCVVNYGWDFCSAEHETCMTDL